MFNRFLKHEREESNLFAGVLARNVSAFVVCPLMNGGGLMGQQALWQEVYRLAREQAEAVAKPSKLELLQVAFSN